MLWRRIGRCGRNQDIDFLQCFLELVSQDDPRFSGTVVNLGRHQGRRLEPGAGSRVQVLGLIAEDFVPGACSFGIGDAHENRPRQGNQRYGHFPNLCSLLPENLKGGLYCFFYVRVHVVALVELPNQSHAQAPDFLTQTGGVVRHRPAAGVAVFRIVAGDGPQYQRAIFDGFAHGRGGVHEPAHGGHAVAAHAGEGGPQSHDTAVGRWTAPRTAGVFAQRSRA